MNDKNDKNELSDIVLNKKGSSNVNKKIILSVATLGIILIIVVMVMNSLNSQGTDNLPQAVLPPKPQPQEASTQKSNEEPLFEDVKVIQEKASSDEDLDKIAQKLKQESVQEQKTVASEQKTVVQEQKTVAPKQKVLTPVKKTVTKPQVTSQIKYYIQVGSFSKYKPNKKFLKSITDLRYHYIYHKATVNGKRLNKVLIGPFKTKKEANNAKRVIRAKIEPGAFLVKLQG